MFTDIDILEMVVIAALAYAAYSANNDAKNLATPALQQKAKTAAIILFIAAGYMLLVGVGTPAGNPAGDPFGLGGHPGLTSLTVMELVVIGAIGYAAYTLYTCGITTPAYIAGGAGAYLLYEAYQSTTDDF